MYLRIYVYSMIWEFLSFLKEEWHDEPAILHC